VRTCWAEIDKMNLWLSEKKWEEGQEVEILEVVDINTLNLQQ